MQWSTGYSSRFYCIAARVTRSAGEQSTAWNDEKVSEKHWIEIVGKEYQLNVCYNFIALSLFISIVSEYVDGTSTTNDQRERRENGQFRDTVIVFRRQISWAKHHTAATGWGKAIIPAMNADQLRLIYNASGRGTLSINCIHWKRR